MYCWGLYERAHGENAGVVRGDDSVLEPHHIGDGSFFRMH